MVQSLSTHGSAVSKDALWPQLTQFRQLWLGWQKVHDNGGGAGGDGVRVGDFARSAPQRIERLAAALTAGRYRPGPLRMVAIPKKHGGQRVLAIPCVVDRVVQTAAAMLLTPIVEPMFEKSSHAYRPGRGVASAVQAILRHRRDGYRWTAEGDVEQCFDEIPHALLLEKLEDAAHDARFVDLVALWLGAYAPAGVGIPQGSPISPLLCNLHLDAIDEAMDGHGIRFVRFADDFVILAKSRARAEAGLEEMAALLRQHHLRLNPAKSRIVPTDAALRFLGHVFIRSMAYKEVEAEEDPPAPPDAPPEEILAQWAALKPPPHAAEAAAPAAADQPPRPSARRTLYLVEPGSLLSVRNDSFLALGPPRLGEGKGADDDRMAARQGRFIEHASRIDRIEIGPGAEADWAALALAAARGIPLAMVDGWGQSAAWMTGPGDIRARRTIDQARFLADAERQERLAMALVRARIRNQSRMLARLNRTRRDPDLAAGAVQLLRQAVRLPARAAAATANGLEGNAARIYWPLYAKLLAGTLDFDWQSWRRDRRPPPDPVNACLGYLAALLERDLRVAIERAGLHPGMGALHVARDGADALVYDLMEVFRAAVPEAIITTMVGRGHIRADMFVVRGHIGPDGREERECRIELAGRRALIQGYESWLARPIKSRRTGQRLLWRFLFEEEARALADLFAGRTDAYRPYEIDY